jgi:cell division protein FtsL
LIAPRSLERSRIRNPRSVRAATARRIGRASRARYAVVTRVFAGLICVLALLMSYVVLTSNLTGLSYALSRAQAEREALLEETTRLDDRIAALRSDDRLSALAVRLGMREPQRFAVIRTEAPTIGATRPRFPVLSSIAGFFAPAVTARR